MDLRQLLRRRGILVGIVAAVASTASAQGPAVVQLPSFSSFGVDTSVSVPDRGSARLGGVGRSSSGSTAFGPGVGLGNRSFGRNLSSSSSSVRATIHDMDALDRETLARARGTAPDAQNLSAATRLSAAQRSTAGQVPRGSVAEARKRRAAEVVAMQADALQTLKRAREAAAAGKTSAASVFYRQAAKLATGELKLQIDKEAAAVANESRTANVARSSHNTTGSASATSGQR